MLSLNRDGVVRDEKVMDMSVGESAQVYIWLKAM